jgi:restriction system protein
MEERYLVESSIACSQCGTRVPDDSQLVAEDQKPCPVCGSTGRRPPSGSGVASLVVSGVGVGFAPGDVFSRASLLVQTVVVPGAATEEGQLIQAVALPWFEIIKALKRDPSLAHRLDPRKWEEIVAGAYRMAGFDEVILAPRSRDYGRDVIAVKHGLGTVRVIDQVKAYRPNHLVTANEVRALLGVLVGDRASKGFLTTTSDFAPMLRDDILLRPFIPAQLELINGTSLLARLQDLAAKGGP